MSNQIMDAIEGIGKSFEEFKKVNDQILDEERKGNEARARELQATLDKIGDELSQHQKNREILEKRLAAQQDRIEIVEALNDRPRATVQDRIRSEHKDLCLQWIRSKGQDYEALAKYKELVSKAREVKDVTIGTDASGGFALPEEISRTVDKLILNFSGIAANVKNVQVGTSDYKELVSVNNASYAWSTETGTRSATTSPELRNRAPTWGELYAYPSASNWSLEDLFFNVENWLVDNISEGFAVGLSTAIYNGNGSGTLTGMVNTAPVTTNDYASPERNHAALEYMPLTSPASPYIPTGVTADSLIDLVYLLRAGYRAGAKFAMNSSTQGHCRRLKDTNGQYLWQPSFQMGQPDMLLGYPVFTWEDLGSSVAANTYPVMFGNFAKAYTLAARSGMAIVRDNITTPGYTAFYVSRRYGGCVTNNNAVKVLKVSIT